MLSHPRGPLQGPLQSGGSIERRLTAWIAAVRLLTLRKTVLAGIRLHGPWLKHVATYLPLPEDDDVLAIGLNRAVSLVDAKRA